MARGMRMSRLWVLGVLSFGMTPLAAYSADMPAICTLDDKSIVSRSPAGLPQVSNLGDIEVRCSVPARPLPSKPGESREAVQVATVASMLSPDARPEPVASEVHPTGGGFDQEREWVLFYVHIPLEPAEADAEARRLLAKLSEAMRALPGAPGLGNEEAQKQALARARDLVYQHRVGHFRVQCRLSADGRPLGAADVEFEVLYKGRFSDAGLPGAPPA